MKHPLDNENLTADKDRETETLQTVDSDKSKKSLNILTPPSNMGSSTSKDEKQNGDNKSSIHGDISMDENTEYSVFSFHSGMAIGIIVIIVIIVIIYYLAFKIRCIPAGSKNTNNMERGMEMTHRQPKVDYAPRFIEVREEAEVPKKTRWISCEQLDQLFE